jgi:uncharacterized membrane protein YphA (DoxX/SURF4 family)
MKTLGDPKPEPAKVRRMPSVTHSIARFLIVGFGLVFALAGAAKAFALSNFAQTIASVTFFPLSTARTMATILILAEILGALLLLARLWIRTTAVIFAFIVACFIAVLSSAIVQHHEIDCHCFGILGLRLSNADELILDVLLLNGFLFIAIVSDIKGRHARQREQTSTATRMLYIASALLLEFLFIFPIISRALTNTTQDVNAVIIFAEQADTLFSRAGRRNRVLLLLDYADFSCPICFEDFSAFADSLSNRQGDGRHHPCLAIFREGPYSSLRSPERVKRWATANHIRFPVYFSPDSVFQRAHVTKSVAVVVDPMKHVLFSEIFPMGLQKRSKALRLFDEPHTSQEGE